MRRRAPSVISLGGCFGVAIATACGESVRGETGASTGAGASPAGSPSGGSLASGGRSSGGQTGVGGRSEGGTAGSTSGGGSADAGATPGAGHTSDAGAGGSSGAAGEGGANDSCAGLDECGCFDRSDCRTLVTACHCPFPQCDDSSACDCGGGTFLGCEPSDCPIPGCVSASEIVGPDPEGCFDCAPPTDCSAAKDTLETRCSVEMGDLSCAGNAECVLACLAAVTSCDDVGCRFCSLCDCALGPNDLTECYQACAT